MSDSQFVIELDGAKLQSASDFYRELNAATQLDLQSNLDALDENLVSEIPLCCGPYRLVWKNAGSSDWSGFSRLTEILGVIAYQQQRHPDRFLAFELQFDQEEDEDTWSYPEIYSAHHYVAERERRLRGKTCK